MTARHARLNQRKAESSQENYDNRHERPAHGNLSNDQGNTAAKNLCYLKSPDPSLGLTALFAVNSISFPVAMSHTYLSSFQSIAVT
jgi:hypothetical protein